MGTTLEGKKIKDTYKSLIKVTDNGEAGSSSKQLSDGAGNDFGLFIDTDGVVGIGAGASYSLDVSSKTDGISFPVGTTANRPSGTAGLVRYNSTLGKLEYYDNSFKKIASEDYVNSEINAVLDSAPDALDTLNEIAAALNDDPDFYTTITGLISAKENTITGAATTITGSDLTASRAVISNASGKVAVSAVTDTELGYLDGVTSAIQTQIDGKQNTLTAGNGIDITSDTISADLTDLVDTGAIQTDAVTAPKIAQFDDNLSAATAGDIMISNGTDFTDVTVSGDITINSSGVTTIGSDKIDGDNIVDDAIDSEHINAGAIDTEHIGDDQVTAAKLADTAVTAGTYGDANNTPQITVDAQGRLTSVTEIATAGSGGGGAGTLDIEQDTFNGDGSTVAFALTSSCDSENNLQVYIDGVYQSKDNFSVSGTTLTFTTAPNTGTDNIEVMHFKSVVGKVHVDTFTGDGSDTTFDVSNTISNENNTQVFLDGVYQSKDNYTTSGTTITFSTAPADGVAIEVIHVVPNSTGGGISWQTTPKTAAFTAIAGEGYFVNTTSAAITVTLPSSPSAGDEVSIVDYAGTADTNNITITSSDNINGSSNDVKIDYERGGVSMVYVDATQGWIAYNANNETAEALIDVPPTISVDYLVVAGGGGGGYYFGAGGGAGGLRTSYGSTSGGGASAESSLGLETAVNYTVTVGAGGAQGVNSSSQGNNGTNSVFSTITSLGGGGAGGGFFGSDPSSNLNGLAGGSGGGAGGTAVSTGGAGTSGQGFAGESTSANVQGGGGGAGEAGGTDGQKHGGDGLEVNIIGGTGNYYAGGGAGGSEPAGLGGGGTSGAAGSPNTGGGGGGDDVVILGRGGSGVVIIRYPNAYTVTIGAGLTGSTATNGSDKVTTFTAGTGNISFS